MSITLHERICKKCGDSKIITDFVIKVGRYQSTCKLCAAARLRAWRKTHKSNVSLYCKTWRSKNIEYAKKYCRIYYYKNKSKQLKRNGLRRNETFYLTEYISRMRCRARQQQVDFDEKYFTRKRVSRMLKKMYCDCCNIKFDSISFWSSRSFDKLIPELGYVKNNVNLICRRCNTIKSNATSQELRMVADWMESRGNTK